MGIAASLSGKKGGGGGPARAAVSADVAARLGDKLVSAAENNKSGGGGGPVRAVVSADVAARLGYELVSAAENNRPDVTSLIACGADLNKRDYVSDYYT